MYILIRETLSFNLMYVTACYPVGTTISKTSSLFTALLQHYICLPKFLWGHKKILMWEVLPAIALKSESINRSNISYV